MVLSESQEEVVVEGDTIPPSIFRAYDIRGIVDEELSYARVEKISRAIGSEALDHGIDSLLVGYDGRLSSPVLSRALIAGILSSGCNVVDLGLVTTPLLYFAAHTTGSSSGVMLTASHNPANYNGLKIVFRKHCLADNQIQSIRNRIEENKLRSGAGHYSEYEIREAYLKEVCSNIHLQKSMRVVIDCGNAVPGTIAPRLFERLGCDVIPLFCEVDGSFPNHHPDPTIPSNLDALAQQVREQGADLGIAFDGDGDRLGMVSETGAVVDADKMLMLLVRDIAPRYPDGPVIFDVKCSTRLKKLIRELGAVPVMHRSGHSFMKQKMAETGAALGGEFAAHLFIKDRWFGFDDGLYAAARLVELLSRLPHSAATEFARYGDTVTTPELKVPVPDEDKFDLVARIIQLADFPGAKLITLDGLRVEYEDGWGLVRASNTGPALLLRFEADSAERLATIKNEFKALINNADNSLELNF